MRRGERAQDGRQKQNDIYKPSDIHFLAAAAAAVGDAAGTATFLASFLGALTDFSLRLSMCALSTLFICRENVAVSLNGIVHDTFFLPSVARTRHNSSGDSEAASFLLGLVFEVMVAVRI